MFSNDKDNFVKVELDTTFYLGRQHVAEQFCDLLVKYNGVYLPEQWDTQQRSYLRHSFDRAAQIDLLQEWTRVEEWKTLFFTRKRPRIEMSVDIKRFSLAKFFGGPYIEFFGREKLLRERVPARTKRR